MAMNIRPHVLKAHKAFERAIVYTLLVLMIVVILYITLQFAYTMIKEIIELSAVNLFRLNASELAEKMDVLHDVFAQFLLILIGIELMKTISMYLEDSVVHVEVVFEVAMIAVARHAIDMDYGKADPLAIAAMALLMVGLTLGYFYYKKTQKMIGGTPGT
jgi:uncharacterized membrane protein (DUF373 family)